MSNDAIDAPETTRRNTEYEVSDFFRKMDEFGFFDRVEDHLPEAFVLVYEIARIFENPEHELTERLAPVFWGAATAKKKDKLQKPPPIPVVNYSEEYEATLMRSHRDIVRIYPHQFLLPDQVFYRKLAERSLWMPDPKPPNNFRYQSESDSFAPDSRKQKVYLLLDTSSSMLAHHRIHLAKAIAYFFLRENMRELGQIYFRTFDIQIGALHQARDKRTFSELIHTLLEIDSVGNGTAMEKALKTAVDDIHNEDSMAEAEILLITDGAVHLDKDRISELLGETIRLHTVKIGSDAIDPSPTYVRDQIKIGDNEHTKMLRKLLDREEDIQRKLRTAGSDIKRQAFQQELFALRQRIDSGVEKFSEMVSKNYGREVEELSHIYVQVDDIDEHRLFAIPPLKLRELEGVSRQMLQALSDHASAEDVKRAALLLNRINVMIPYNKEAGDLAATAAELKAKLEPYLDSGGAGTLDQEIEFSMMDQQQIMKILKPLFTPRSTSSASLLKMLYLRIKRRIKQWLQRRRFRL